MEEEEEEEEQQQRGEQQRGDSQSSTAEDQRMIRLPFALGGPIYPHDYVGPITSVPDFKAAALQQLQDLEAELGSAADFDVELSVDELKVFTEEDLVEKALKEESEDITEIGDSSETGKAVNHSCISGQEAASLENSALEESNSECCVSLNDSSILTCGEDVSEEGIQPKKRKKRGRVFDRNIRAAELQGSFFDKVKQLANIKQKQDEDKLAARLHSFSYSFKSVEGKISTSKKIESMRSPKFITAPLKVEYPKSQEIVPLCYPEVVLCVDFYHKNTSLKTQEILVLGSQSVAQLRDSIYCLTDRLMQTAGENDPSGYFLIEDTFCVDTRDSSAIDYTLPIFDWLKSRKDEAEKKWEYIMAGELKKRQKDLLGGVNTLNLPKFKSVDMHKTCFSDLQFRLGAGYLYCHQGNCKHIVVIRDMRLIHLEDVQSRVDYPLIAFQHKTIHKKCSVCNISQSTKMSVDDKWAAENPCYFCINCYFLLHYKEDNSLLYPHVVFDYFDE